jgi:uncharacterized protein YndB with AHSA1/START domain
LAAATWLAKRVHAMSDETPTTSRIILAAPRAIFRAFVDPETFLKWRAPADRDARLLAFEAGTGGGYRIELVQRDPENPQSAPGTGGDLIEARFLDLLPDERVVEAVAFRAQDQRLARDMTITTTFVAVVGGTKVTVTAEGMPDGIDAKDHADHMAAALKKLADLLE